MSMKRSIRCCISCIFPCGALDVIRIVHSNGRVEEISGTVRASDVLKDHPKHVLKKPTTISSSSSSAYVSDEHSATATANANANAAPPIVVVPPDAELQRGKIYFLIPTVSSSSNNNNTANVNNKKKLSSHISSPAPAVDQAVMMMRKQMRKSTTSTADHHVKTTSNSTTTDHRRRRHHHRRQQQTTPSNSNSNSDSDRYLSEILSEINIISTQRDRDRRSSRGRVAVWRPRLQSISESPDHLSRDP